MIHYPKQKSVSSKKSEKKESDRYSKGSSKKSASHRMAESMDSRMKDKSSALINEEKLKKSYASSKRS